MDTIKRVQDLMQARDMNLCVLAKKCGISYSTIQTTARRGGQLSVETIERICLGLGSRPARHAAVGNSYSGPLGAV